ncbi:MAG: zinc-ribbon domain-containing protein, partial [Desulfobacteraceae bacterium]|nr:zinc-ribbon domain-containing protein [Desulfobacteraceae bacterium]
MKIICDKCQGKYTVADEKLPEGKQFGFTCPKCKNRIAVMKGGATPSKDEDIVFSITGDESHIENQNEDTAGKKRSAFAFDEEDSTKPSISFTEDESIYDSNEKPFDFVEEDYETALICETDPAIREKVKIALDLMEYSITNAENTREALKNMRYHTYDLVVLN